MWSTITLDVNELNRIGKVSSEHSRQGLKSSLPSWSRSKLPGKMPDFFKPKIGKMPIFVA